MAHDTPDEDNTASNADRFEQTALKVTGTAFYILQSG
jgi:hypothetical protein